jgi:alkylation response protein AidB-like acyl-CoA dehydrogenase
VDGGRVNIAACSVGGGQFCLDYARRYVQERMQFGQPLSTFQAIEFRIADMATALHASRLLVRQAAQALDAKVGLGPGLSLILPKSCNVSTEIRTLNVTLTAGYYATKY